MSNSKPFFFEGFIEETGVKNDMVWRTGRHTPTKNSQEYTPGGVTSVFGRATARGTKTDWNDYKLQDGVNIQARLGESRERFGKSLGTADLYPRQ